MNDRIGFHFEDQGKQVIDDTGLNVMGRMESVSRRRFFGQAGMLAAGTFGMASFAASTEAAAQVCVSRCFDVHEYGAVGDGGTDDQPAIQAAIDAAVADGGGIVTFEHRTYMCNSTVFVRGNNINLRGADGKRGTVISCNGEDGIEFDGIGAGGSIRYCGMYGIHLLSENATGHGLVITKGVENHFENVFISWFRGEGKYGIYIQPVVSSGDSWVNTFVQVTSAGNSAGLFNIGSAHTFITCRFQGNDGVGVQDYGYAPLFLNCDFEGNGSYGVNTSQNYGKTFIGCYWEKNTLAQLHCIQTRGLTIHGGRMFAGASNSTDKGLVIGRPAGEVPSGVSIQGLSFIGPHSTCAVHLVGAVDVMLSGLNFSNETEKIVIGSPGVSGTSFVQGTAFHLDGLTHLQSMAGDVRQITTNDSPYQVGSEVTILANPTQGEVNVVLPSASASPGKIYYIKNVACRPRNKVIITPYENEKIDGKKRKVLRRKYQSVGITNNGENWYIVS